MTGRITEENIFFLFMKSYKTCNQTDPSFNPFPNKIWFLLVCSTYLLKKNVGKGKIAPSEQFFLFPQSFSTRLDNFLAFSTNLKLSSVNSFTLEESKICRWERAKERRHSHTMMPFDAPGKQAF